MSVAHSARPAASCGRFSLPRRSKGRWRGMGEHFFSACDSFHYAYYGAALQRSTHTITHIYIVHATASTCFMLAPWPSVPAAAATEGREAHSTYGDCLSNYSRHEASNCPRSSVRVEAATLAAPTPVDGSHRQQPHTAPAADAASSLAARPPAGPSAAPSGCFLGRSSSTSCHCRSARACGQRSPT